VVPEALAVILRNAHAQREMLTRLLTLSSILTGRLLIDQCPLNLWLVVMDALERLQPHADARLITLTLRPPDIPLLVRGDAQRLRQAVGELLANALNYTTSGDFITITGSQRDDRAAVSIHDSGRGLAPDDLTRIFTPFLQVQRDETIGGYGIGLALVRGIVEAHSGQILAESPGRNQGSTFTIALPLAEA
jgi:signal transduction histidine kinase